jgi:sigma-B regulation protein RsbU (phosphoserine phosphatase)
VSTNKNANFFTNGNCGAGRSDFQRIFRLDFGVEGWKGERVAEELASLRKSLEIYRGLVEVSALINSITDYDELLQAILEVARRVMHAEAASLFLRDEADSHLDLVIASHKEGEFTQPKIRVESGQGIAGWVLEHGQSLLIPDAYEDPRFFRGADRATGFRTRSILCSPLRWNDSIIGVLQVLNPSGKESFEPEDLEGFDAYSNLIATAIQKLRAIERLRQQERIEREVSIAAEIQQELLSRAVPDDVPGAIFASYNKAATDVGGDFFFVLPRSRGEIYFAIGDVSGKGMPASLLMAQTLSAMQFVFATADSPSGALSWLNATLHDHIVRGMFVTLLVGRMLPATRRIELASAGHCRPFVVRPDGGPVEIQTDGALPLGVLPDVVYQQRHVDLGADEFLICFTDGLTESRDPRTEQFFDEDIANRLRGPFASAQAIVDHLVNAEQLHRDGTPTRDDLTLLALTFR